MREQSVTLKWGTLKGWDNASDDAMDLLHRYHEFPVSWGVADQRDTPEQKELLIELVKLPDMRIYLDWDDKYISSEEAVKYLTEYRKEAPCTPQT